MYQHYVRNKNNDRRRKPVKKKSSMPKGVKKEVAAEAKQQKPMTKSGAKLKVRKQGY